jgi:1-acyl-sn-glycerol-3-phosphate acyltransferase
MRVRGRRHVPHQGGLLVIANHQSFLDPPLVGVAIRRHLNYLARKTLFRNRLFGGLIGSVGAIPLDQVIPGTEGIKAALALLKAGKAVLIFPEGSRTPHGRMQPLKPGVVVLIRRGGVPILPVGVAGAFEAWPIHRKWPRWSPLFWPDRSHSVAAVIGEPIPTERLARLPPEQILKELATVLADLAAQAEALRRR